MSDNGPQITLRGSKGLEIEDYHWEREAGDASTGGVVYTGVVLKAELMHDNKKAADDQDSIQMEIGVDTERRGRGWQGRAWIPLKATKERVNGLNAVGFGHEEREGITFGINDLVRCEVRVRVKRLLDKKTQVVRPKIVELMPINADGTKQIRPSAGAATAPVEQTAQTTGGDSANDDEVPF